MTSCCVGDSQCSPSDTSQSKESSRQHKIPTPYWHWTSTHWRKNKNDKKKQTGDLKQTKNASNDFITEKIAGSEVVSRDTVNIRQSKVIKINILSRTVNTWGKNSPTLLPTNNQSYAQSDVIDGGGGWDFVPFPFPDDFIAVDILFLDWLCRESEMTSLAAVTYVSLNSR